MKKWFVALCCSAGLMVSVSAELYSTGFELAEGWATGSLGTNPESQPPGGAWDNAGVAQVQGFNPRTGDYSVYFNSTDIGNHTAIFTPPSAYSNYTTVTVSYYVYLPAYPSENGNTQLANDNNHRLELVTDATTLRLQMDNFGTEGNPERHRAYVAAGLGAGGENGLIEQVWAAGEWTHIQFTLNFAENTYAYYVASPTRGFHFVEDRIVGHDISELQSLNIIHRDVGTALNVTMYMDDFSVYEGAPAIPSPPAIIEDPVAATVFAGDMAEFSVSADGDAPLAYQWRENGTVLSGATSDTLQVGPVVPAQDGHTYDVIVSNPYGAITSAVATLSVALPPDALYYTGFELGEGWSTGSLGVNPENQPPGGAWGNTSIAQVQPHSPHTGAHSVYFNSASIGNHTASFTPDAVYAGYETLTISYFVYLPTYPNADGNSQISNDNNHRLLLATDATTLTFQWDNFDATGNPGRQRTWMQAGLGAGGEQGVINQSWEPGEWIYMAITLDFVNNTYSYLVDSPTKGVNSVADQAIGHDITSLSSVSLIHRDVGAALNLTMYVDDFMVTGSLADDRPGLRFGPSPAAGTLLLEWDSSVGETYRVELSPSLVSPDWELLEVVSSTNEVTQWLYEIPELDALGFIRLMEAE